MKKVNKEKIILVTGGSGLIGKSIIKDLTEDGYFPINIDITSAENSCEHFECDITKEDEIEGVFKLVYEKYGRIDGLVNNAYPRKEAFGADFFDVQEKHLIEQLHFQLASYYLCCQKVLPYLQKSNGGSIVNISSIYGSVGNDFSLYENTKMNPPGVYNMVKGGINSLTNYLAAKFGKDQIRVNTISPGGIFDNQDKKFVEKYIQKVPLSRMGNPDDISPVICFLMSDKSKYITGQNILVDGGLTCL